MLVFMEGQPALSDRTPAVTGVGKEVRGRPLYLGGLAVGLAPAQAQSSMGTDPPIWYTSLGEPPPVVQASSTHP